MSLASWSGVGGAPPWSGRLGADTTRGAEPFTSRIADIAPNGPSEKAGLRPGDVIDYRANSLLERYWITTRSFNGRAIPLDVRRGDVKEKITVVPAPRVYAKNWKEFVAYELASFVTPLLSVWCASLAALMAWRRSNVPELRLLAITLALYALFNVQVGPQWAVPWLWVYIAIDLAGSFTAPLMFAASVAFAGTFSRPLSRPRRAVHAFCYTMAAIVLLENILGSIGFITELFDPTLSFLKLPVEPYRVMALSLLAAFILAIAASRGAEMQKAVWTLIPLALLLSFGLLASIFFSLVATAAYFSNNLIGLALISVQFAAPVALTYAALSRRMIDVGFALNRAAIFTCVSLVVVGLFTLAEWALAGWLHNANKVTNVAVSAGLALALGLSIHPIHARVDRFVDTVFFRKRHEDEKALVKFAHEAAFMTDRDVILERATNTLEAHTDATSVNFALYDGFDRYGGIDENDPALVTLRASHEVVDLHGLDTALQGDLAYPMLTRGRLVGALVLGPKRSGESYAPDESNAIAQVAHGVGVALDLLDVEGEKSNSVLIEIRDTMRSLSQRVNTLGEDVAEIRRERASL